MAKALEKDGAAKAEQMRKALLECYGEAEKIVASEKEESLIAALGKENHQIIKELGGTNHAARGVALTLCAYKIVSPDQDIRAHKSDHKGGFSGRTFDSGVTIPFLIEKELPRSVESHWLSQTFSFAGPYVPEMVLKTVPKAAGPLLIQAVNIVQEKKDNSFAHVAVTTLLVEMIRIRNQGKVVLTRPKDLSIEKVAYLIDKHISQHYKANAPRLPQLVIYAIYQCIVQSVGRYKEQKLEPIERMKSADRKAGTVGDIVLTRDKAPVEAVEIKHGQKISYVHVAEAIDKVRAVAVRRYYILSNMGVAPEDQKKIEQTRIDFLQKNGCEIIINGIVETLSYYLRLLPTTTEFIFAYAALLESDPDINYEHRIVWNECCQSL